MRHPFSSLPSHSSPPPPPLPSLLLVPPLRYELVEDKLYRGSYPTLRNLPFLARLRLKSLLSLTPEPPTSDLTSFCKAEGIQLHHYHVAQPIEDPVLPSPILSSALSHLLELEHLPVYIHCLDGRGITSLLVAALRRLQGWAVPSIVEEYGRFNDSPDGVHSLLDTWKGPVPIPRNLPHWLWDGKHVAHHPHVQVVDPTLTGEREGGGEKKPKPPASDPGKEEEKTKDDAGQHPGPRTLPLLSLSLPAPAVLPLLIVECVCWW